MCSIKYPLTRGKETSFLTQVKPPRGAERTFSTEATGLRILVSNTCDVYDYHVSAVLSNEKGKRLVIEGETVGVQTFHENSVEVIN
jgi:hypothetical protein